MIFEAILWIIWAFLLIILLAFIIYFLILIFIGWYSKKEMFDDKYDYYISLGISEEKAREKAEWHTR